MAEGFVPPPYPYDRLRELEEVLTTHEGGGIDLSIGTPCDAPPAELVARLADATTVRGYPPSIGTIGYREAAAGWVHRRFGVELEPEELAACVGTKEFVASTPQYLRLRNPSRDTVLYPAVSYPTYAMGATLAGCRAVPVPVDEHWAIDIAAIDPADAARAVCLWVNTPGNPAGGLDDLEAAAAWGREHGVPVLSDECYVEFTWDGTAQTILEHGSEGVLAVHSLSKRSNLAGARAGFYAGDADLVHYLSEVRKHAGLMVPGPVQVAGAWAWSDDDHVTEQRARYHRRLELAVELMAAAGVEASMPRGGFYVWAAAPDGDAWALARRLAEDAGVLVSPGEFYGPDGAGHVRVAVVQPEERLELAVARMRAAG